MRRSHRGTGRRRCSDGSEPDKRLLVLSKEALS